jgi:hypothetical protein
MSDHRTQGETKDCKGCGYWSEMIARCDGGGPVLAMCLSPTSPNRHKYTGANRTCADWCSGHFGATDEPGQDPYAYVQGSDAQ